MRNIMDALATTGFLSLYHPQSVSEALSNMTKNALTPKPPAAAPSGTNQALSLKEPRSKTQPTALEKYHKHKLSGGFRPATGGLPAQTPG